MDIAHLLNPDHRPAMDIARLLTRDDSDQSDQVADSPTTPSQEAVVPPPAPQTSPKPASPPQTPATPAIPEKPATTAPVKPVTPPQTSATPIPLSEMPVSTAPSPQLGVPPASLPESSLTAVLPSQRAVARARPKRPRKPTIASLRVQKEVCELVVKHLPYVLRDLDDASSSTSTINSTDSEEDDATDPDAHRIRWFLKRMVVLSGQMEVERAKQIEYLRLLKRHYEGTANLHKLMGGLALDYWFWMCDRWRLLARDFYEPLSESKCYAIMHETLQAIKSYKLPEGTKQSDAFGWHDWVRLDADELYVRFMTRKTLMNADLEQLVEHSWSIYSDGDLFKTAHLGDNCEFFLQVLQRISSDVIIIQRVEKYPGLEQLTHSLVILFRVQTDTGFMIIFRCIESPRLQGLMKADGLSLGGSFFWENFDVVPGGGEDGCDAIRFTLAGSIGSDNPTYARRWRNELVIALVRYEIQYLDTPILSAEPPLESDNDVTADSQAPPS